MIEWWQDWAGECVAIVAAGPSADKVGVQKLRDRIHVIAVNESFRLVPWADIIYSAEGVWWSMRGHEVSKCPGLKLTFEPNAIARHRIEIVKQKTVETVWSMKMEWAKRGHVGSGGNSGFQMVNLAAQFGATGIALIGFDMNMNGGCHWHVNHPVPLRNPTYERFAKWIAALDGAAPDLAQHGVDVINCSPTSSLTAFPKLSIDAMLERWGL